MNARLFTGIIYILISFSSFFFPEIQSSKLFLAAAFYVGVIYICEFVTLSLKGTSLVREVRGSGANLFSFVVASTIGGLLIDGVNKFLGKLWVYPDWSGSFYLFIFVPGFAAYWLVITESYLAAKALLDFLHTGRRKVTKPHAYERKLFFLLGFAGVALVGAAILSILHDYGAQTLPLLRENSVSVFDAVFSISFGDVLVLFLGTWFVLEFVEFVRKGSSLIHDILHAYYTPLFAIALGAATLSVFMELQNIPAGLWRYTNWPFAEYAFLGLPVTVWLAWPLQYVTFLSLFRALTGKESDAVWEGDTIR